MALQAKSDDRESFQFRLLSKGRKRSRDSGDLTKGTEPDDLKRKPKNEQATSNKVHRY